MKRKQLNKALAKRLADAAKMGSEYAKSAKQFLAKQKAKRAPMLKQ